MDVDQAAKALQSAHNLRISHTYHTAIQGMAAEVPEGRLTGLRQDPRVAYIEKDQPVEAFAQTLPTGIQRIFADDNVNIAINSSDDYRIDADVAVLDTGIDYDHPDLNVYKRTNCAKGGPNNSNCKNNEGDDGNGHGTHVAGTIGALDNNSGVVGVAPGARLWAVRVLDNNGSGWMSWIIAGVDYVTAHADQIDVANMSLGCECSSDALNTAITNSVAAGLTYAVAAGNSDKDAATFSPANHPDVITVSALADFDGLEGALGLPTCRTDEDDTLANFSNWGSSVEITAPGVCILSTWKDGGYATISGTSMASPHTAGAAALLAASGYTNPATIRSTLINEGNLNWTDDSGDAVKEPLLDVRNTTIFNPAVVIGSGTTGNTAPTADFTHAVSDLSVSFTDQSTDGDGTVVSWSWDFGNGGTSTTQHPDYTYEAAGTYDVSLVVTDNEGAPNTVIKSVRVGSFIETISLSATGHKIKGIQHADLTWSDATTTNVDVYRDGLIIATTANDGTYTDNIGNRGGGSYTYKVCEEGTTTCSNEATVTF